MKTFMVDWKHGESNDISEIETNHFRSGPLFITTEDKFCIEMEARMTIQIDDDSVIIGTFGSFPAFITNALNNLITYFFWYKERNDIMTNRLEIKKELVDELQERLTKYGVKISDIVMVSMLTCEPCVKKYKVDKNDAGNESIKEIHSSEDLSDLRRNMFSILLERMLLLLVLATVAFVLIMISIYYGNKIYMILGSLVSITVIVMGIYQYLEIRKIRKMIKQEKGCKTCL